MPWQNNNGGNGGPWGSGDGNGPRNPWGNGPQRPGGPSGGGGGGKGGPDFDEFIRRSQERLRGLPGGGGGKAPWLYILLAVLGVWVVFTSFYRVDAQERGVVMRFGKYVETTGPGMHFKLPAPIDTVVKPKVEQVSTIDIGSADASSENLMLTGDQNIIDIAYTVRWKIKDPEQFLFQFAEPEETIREVAESAMRAEISAATLNAAIGPQRAQIAEQVRVRSQELLDSYRAGVDVLGVDIKQADPPAAVDAAFKDVSAAQQNAQGYLNQARAYSQQLIAQAQGEAAAFDAVYAQYRLAPEVTRKRMYLETMENVLAKVDKTVIEANGVTPYLPLPEVQRRARAATTAAADANSNQ
ncbi:FtsH protease activity modulator HflK [Sphingoaurantiacus capsulatus]|uniref:Protein HflK n=1 Tax=Sphingoaurantiacus capsulatus TaxID=1771310 RepID=A0ABV7X7D0_9SPHN